ncbi:hypothetical protein GYMLUDRAFT_375017 [Collybiopsis luxurians FD-317 M1]|uniref:Uncharacterized protein n=1 Tax=Collybiopsis luxurians FD-317 M1 TaxID=944289 RepID=A0A0D0CAX6_9AGAR|nr:hypothetical protein GYMLUDRAFT_375017 [Collybiopsis luxurians FD-317 M1]
MANHSGFHALATELHHLTVQEIIDLNCILAFRRAYATYNSFLYQDIDTLALPALGLPPKARLPLAGPHPAAFVKHITFAFPYDDSLALFDREPERCVALGTSNKKRTGPATLAAFRKLVPAAMYNIMFYAPHSAIKTIEYQCDDLSLANVFNKLD